MNKLSLKIQPKDWWSTAKGKKEEACVVTDIDGFAVYEKEEAKDPNIVYANISSLEHGGLKIQVFPLGAKFSRKRNPEVYLYPEKMWIVFSDSTDLPAKLFPMYWTFSPYEFLKLIVESEKEYQKVNPLHELVAEKLIFQGKITKIPFERKASWADFYDLFKGQII